MQKQLISLKDKPTHDDNIVNIDSSESNLKDNFKRDAKSSCSHCPTS